MTDPRDPVHPPQFTLRGLEPATVAELREEADLEGVDIAANAGDQRVEWCDARLLECRVTHLASPEADLRGASVRETELLAPTVTVLKATRGRWCDVRVSGGRLGVVEAYDADWERVELVGGKASYLNLRGSAVTDLTLRDCALEELDLAGATVRRVALPGTSIGRLTVRQATMHAVDLREATLDTIDGVEHLRGTIVTSPQLHDLAPHLAAALGLTVADASP